MKHGEKRDETMILAIMRHGQTIYNANMRVQGHANIPLTDKGRQQIKAVAKKLSEHGEQFDMIASSPLSRALESAYWVAKKLRHHKPIVVEQRFIERDFNHLDGEPVESAMPLVREPGYSHEGYEDDGKLINRVVRAALKMDARFHGQKVLMVAHSHVIKSLLIHAEPDHWSFRDFINHGDLFYFDISQGTIKFLERKKA